MAGTVFSGGLTALAVKVLGKKNHTATQSSGNQRRKKVSARPQHAP